MKSTGTPGSAASSLVEVALALGIAGLCLVAVMGLLPVGVNSSQGAFSQTAAASIITHVLADFRATPARPPGSTATLAQYSISIPANSAGGGSTTKTLYSGDSLQQFSFAPQVGSSLVTWPASLDPASSTATIGGHVQAFCALNRN